MGFFKKFLGAILNGATAIGTVSGGEYNRYTVNSIKTENGEDGLKLAMLGKQDVILTKANVREFITLETGAKWTSGSGSNQKICLGNRYKVVTNEGKSAIINILANYTSKVEAIFIL